MSDSKWCSNMEFLRILTCGERATLYGGEAAAASCNAAPADE